MDVAYDFIAPERLSPGARLRVRLDRRRARRLVAPRRRRRLARRLERLVAVAEGPQTLHGSAVPVIKDEVLGCRGLLYGLAAELDGEGPITPRGVMLIRKLLCDSASAVYAPAPEGTLELELRRARAVLLAR